MQTPIHYKCRENNLWLSTNRIIYWEEEKALIASDLHFGKTGHFRKSGIAVPQNIFKEDLQRLIDQISFFKAEQLIIVGDLFHSESNKEMELFKKSRKDFAALHIHLIKGNHDILENDWYTNAALQVTENKLQINDFVFVHDINHINLKEETNHYFFSGHIHPGIQIKGMAKQNLYLPCFCFGKQVAILPAFSRFTGLYSIKPKKNEIVYAITDEVLIKI